MVDRTLRRPLEGIVVPFDQRDMTSSSPLQQKQQVRAHADISLAANSSWLDDSGLDDDAFLQLDVKHVSQDENGTDSNSRANIENHDPLRASIPFGISETDNLVNTDGNPSQDAIKTNLTTGYSSIYPQIPLPNTPARLNNASERAPSSNKTEVYDWSSSPAINSHASKRTLPWLREADRYCPCGSIKMSQQQYLKPNPQNQQREYATAHCLKNAAVLEEEEDIDFGTLGIAKVTAAKNSSHDVLQTPQNLNLTDFLSGDITQSAMQRKKLQRLQLQPDKDRPVNQPHPVSTIEPVEKRGRATPASLFLSEEQKQVIDIIKKGKSVFFTGSAGTGKSVLLRSIIRELREIHGKDNESVAVTASTGLAACQIGGVTLHSFSGIGLGVDSPNDLVKKLKKNPKAKQRWLRAKLLIIDEISMVDADLFDKLEVIARVIRRKEKPFGGIQLVVTGDFFQLPPVPNGSDGIRDTKFTFEAACWNSVIGQTIALQHVFRQKDEEFINMLNDMRKGKLSEQTIIGLRSLQRAPKYEDGIEPTELFPTRYEVENANRTRLRAIREPPRIYTARDDGTIHDPVQRSRLLANSLAPAQLELRKGAQVMLIKNIDATLVNGSVGKVIGYMDEKTFSYWASCGISNIDDSQYDDPFAFMQARNIEPSDDENSYSEEARKRKAAYSTMLKISDSEGAKLWPLIRFKIPDGTTRDRLCTMEQCAATELPNGEIQARRYQVPLILAYALSIHKAQGQTLQRVKVNLGRVFEKGQAYVALSRAVSREGLQVLNFHPSKVMCHPRVTLFYRSLETAEAAAKITKLATLPPAFNDKITDDYEFPIFEKRRKSSEVQKTLIYAASHAELRKPVRKRIF